MPFYGLSLFLPYIHQVKQRNWKFIIRVIYFILSIIIDSLSAYKIIDDDTTHYFSWGLTLISLFPLPLYNTSKENNILLKVFLYIFPFYILLTRSFFYMSISYASFFSTGNVASISGFNISSVFRFFSIYRPMPITALILIKILLPTLFISSAIFEIFELYDYSTIDTLFMLISMSEVMNIKFFFDIRDWGSWREIGMSIAYSLISNIISFMQFLIFLFAKIIFMFDNKISKCYLSNSEIEENLSKSILNKELEMGIQNPKNTEFGTNESINDSDNDQDKDKESEKIDTN